MRLPSAARQTNTCTAEQPSPRKNQARPSRVFFETVRQFSKSAHMKNLHLHTELVPRRICKPPAETVALADADRHGAWLLRLRRRSRCARFLRAQFYTLDYTVIPARNARNFAKKITQINKFFCFLCVSLRSLYVFFDFFMIFCFSRASFPAISVILPPSAEGQFVLN